MLSETATNMEPVLSYNMAIMCTVVTGAVFALLLIGLVSACLAYSDAGESLRKHAAAAKAAELESKAKSESKVKSESKARSDKTFKHPPRPKPAPRDPKIVLEQVSKNPRLDDLLKRCEQEVSPKARGPNKNNYSPVENDPRRPEGSADSIILLDATHNFHKILKYGRCAIGKARQQAADEAIAGNKQRYLTLGPPYFTDPRVQEMVAMDSFPKYLYCICVVDFKEFNRMEMILRNRYPRRFSDYEYQFFTKEFDDILGQWNKEYVIALFTALEEIYEETTARAFYKWVSGPESTMFDSLCCFYDKFGEYINYIELSPRIMQRLPIQGLILLLFRDLNEEKTLMVMYWIKLSLFGMLRPSKEFGDKIDLDAARYPMKCMLKLKEEHEFPTIDKKTVLEIGEIFAFEPLKTDDDWEFEDPK